MATPETSTVADLLEVLDLERIESDIFRGISPKTPWQRSYGGQVAGQALVAAGRTVDPERQVHSLHAYFLRPGDVKVPIVYEVDRLRDGASFSTRRVVAIQHGKPIFNLQCSFQIPENGFEHSAVMPVVPDPETLPTIQERFSKYAHEMNGWWGRPRPIDMRYLQDPPRIAAEVGEPREPVNQVWIKADGHLPDDPLLHVCLLTYASDSSLLDSVLLPHGLSWGTNCFGASLDHAMWFHRPFRADEWMLYDQRSDSASGGRGLAHGNIFTRDGRLVVSVVQEGLIRSNRLLDGTLESRHDRPGAS